MADFPEVGLQAVIEGLENFNKSAEAILGAYQDISKGAEGVEQSSMGSAVAFGAVAGAASAAVSGGISLLVGVLSSVADNLVNAATAGFRFAQELDSGMDKVAARTGETGAALDAFRQSAEAVYELGMGASFADAANAMAQVHQVTGQTGEALQGLTADALTLQEAFGTGIRQSVRAVNSEMETFGITGQQAFDLITVMMQQTGDPAGDLAMTVAKFGPSFADAGFSAEQMAFVLTQGLQAGAVNARMVADTVQELFATLKGGSEKTQEALNQLFATPGDAATVFKQKVSDLNQTIADQQVALDDTKRALDSAQGAWGDSKQVVNDLRQALSDAQSQLEDMSRPNLAGMDAYNDRIFNLEQQSKEARLAMLQFGEDTPEFAAAKQRLEGINTELEKARLAKEIEFAPQLRALEQAAAAGTEQIVTFDQAMAEVAAKKTEIAGLTAKLQDAEVASAANAEKVKLLSAKYNDLQGSLSLNKDKLTILKDEFANASTPAKEFIDNLATGAMTGPEAMSKIIEGLAKVEDPIERNKLGVALFGGAWKNLGEDVISAMDPTLGTLANVEGATERARGALTGGLDDSWEKFTRTLQMSLGEGFLPILNMLGEKLGPSLQSFADWLKGEGGTALQEFGKTIAEKVGPMLEKLGPFIQDTVLPTLLQFSDWFINTGLPAISGFFDWLGTTGLPALEKLGKFIADNVLPALSSLSDTFKTSGEKGGDFGKTFQQIQDIAASFQKFWDKNGKQIMDAVEKVWKFVSGFIGENISVALETVQLLLDVLNGDWESAWKRVQKITDKLLNIITLGITGKAKEIGANIGKALSDWLAEWGKKWEEMKSLLAAKWEDMKKKIADTLAAIGSEISAKWDEFKKTITDALGAIGTAISSKWDEFSKKIADVLASIGTAISNKWDEFKKKISDVLAAIGTEIAKRWDEFKKKITDTLDAISTAVSNKWEEIKSAISAKLNEIGTAISTRWEEFKTTIATKLNEIATAISTKWEEFKTTIATKLNEIGTSISTKWTEFKATIATKLEEIKTSITTKWEEFKTAISNKLNEIGTTISTKWAEFLTTISNKLAEIKTAVETKFQEIYDAVKAKLTSLADIPNQIKDTLIGIGTAIMQKILDGVNAFLTFGSKIIAKVTAGAVELYISIVSAGGVLFNFLEDIGSQILGKIVDGIQGVLTFASDIKNKITSGVRTAVTDAWNSIVTDGGRIVDAIKAGIVANWDAFVRWLKNLIGGIFGASEPTDPTSPFRSSRLARSGDWIGRTLVQSIQAGMEGALPTLAGQLQANLSLAAVAAPIAAPAYARTVGGPTYVSNTFQVGGNTIATGMDEAIFEARVLKIIRSNL